MSKSISKINRADVLTPSVALLVLMNMIPLAGVLLLGWDIGFIMLLYWMETVIIGLFNIPKILTCRLPPQGSTGQPGFGGLIFIAVFFTVHYGAFNFGHYMFLKDMFDLPPIGTEVQIAVAGFALSHAVSLLVNWFGKREYERNDPAAQMFKPYGRVVIMHIVIILGGGIVLAFNGALAVLILLIVLKTGTDVVAHVKGHEFKAMLSQSSENAKG
jgi:hypothetical protein